MVTPTKRRSSVTMVPVSHDADALVVAVKAAYDGTLRAVSPQLDELRAANKRLDVAVGAAVKELRERAEEFKDGSADMLVRTVERVRRDVTEDVGRQLESFFAEVRGKLDQIAGQVRESEARVYKVIEERAADLRGQADDRAGATERRLDGRVELLKAGYEVGLDRLLTAVRSLPVPQVVNNLPELRVDNHLPELMVTNRVEVNPTPVTVENTVSPTPVNVAVNPTPVTVENTVSPTPVEITNAVNPTPVNVTAPEVRVAVNPTPVTVQNEVLVDAVAPPREKTIEYDDAGRPVRTVEKDLKGR